MSWWSTKIAKVCNRTQVCDPRSNPKRTFLYIDISAIDRTQKVITSALEILGEEAPSRARKEVLKGDILVSTVRPNLNAVAMISLEQDGQIASTGFCVLRPNPSLIEGKYLFYFTMSSDFVSNLANKVRGAHYPAVSDANVKKIDLPLPTLSEQRRIVEILDQADDLRKKRVEADKIAERILPALFHKMFGDPATNPKGWPIKSLGEVIIGNPQYGANASAKEWSEGNPRYVRITDITDDGRLQGSGFVTLDLQEWEPYHLSPGDLLIARSGNTVGKTYIHRKEDGLCAFAGYLLRFKADLGQVEPWYLFALTQTGYYKRWVEARKRVAGQPNINGREYANFQITCPPVTLQHKFALIVEQLIYLQGRRGASVVKLNKLFHVLLQRAFSGDLTAKWREVHMKELLAEMEEQAKLLNASSLDEAL